MATLANAGAAHYACTGVSVHQQTWLDPKTAKGPDGRAAVLIMAKVTPCGPLSPKTSLCP